MTLTQDVTLVCQCVFVFFLYLCGVLFSPLTPQGRSKGNARRCHAMKKWYECLRRVKCKIVLLLLKQICFERLYFYNKGWLSAVMFFKCSLTCSQNSQWMKITSKLLIAFGAIHVVVCPLGFARTRVGTLWRCSK